MATRLIIDKIDIIEKIVPSFNDLEKKIFPSFYELQNWESACEQIYELLEGTNSICQSAVVQQYNEYYIWNDYLNKNSVLAPIISFSFDNRNLPILTFPKFIPIEEDNTFYRYTDNECLIKLGFFAAEHNISFDKIKDFINEIEDICFEYDLNINDIYFNPTNIGYNKQFGLRVIDYGLKEAIKNKKFELVT